MTDKIPFDVEKWRSGKYNVVTRDGRKVLSMIIHPIECYKPISCVLENVNESQNYYMNGRHYDPYKASDEHEFDLFLTPKKRKVWIAVSKGGALLVGGAAPLDNVVIKRFPLDQYWHIEVELPVG